jgi:hypothetical protein
VVYEMLTVSSTLFDVELRLEDLGDYNLRRVPRLSNCATNFASVSRPDAKISGYRRLSGHARGHVP